MILRRCSRAMLAVILTVLAFLVTLGSDAHADDPITSPAPAISTGLELRRRPLFGAQLAMGSDGLSWRRSCLTARRPSAT
jgi:hypothetical protein